MEDWMHGDAMIYEVFQQPGAYPYPFGSTSLGQLEKMSEAELRRLSWGRLRDQAVSVDQVFAECKGRYWALWHTIERQGLTPYLGLQALLEVNLRLATTDYLSNGYDGL